MRVGSGCISHRIALLLWLWHLMLYKVLIGWLIDLTCCFRWCIVLVGHPSQWQNLALAGNEGLAQGRVGKNSVSVMVDHFWVTSVSLTQTQFDTYSCLIASMVVPCNTLYVSFSVLYAATVIELLWNQLQSDGVFTYLHVVYCCFVNDTVKHCAKWDVSVAWLWNLSLCDAALMLRCLHNWPVLICIIAKDVTLILVISYLQCLQETYKLRVKSNA